MMEALGLWLKQIILVVLLATFIDLLLPNRTMQRYVKLVVSLFILMTILSPVLRWFGGGADLRMLAATVEGWSVAGTLPAPPSSDGDGTSGGTAARGSMPAVGELLEAGERIARERNAQSLELLASRLESMVVEHVTERYGAAHAAAEAELSLDGDGMPRIDRIAVRIGRGETSRDESTDARAEGMKPVDPVTVAPVTIEPIRIGDSSAVGGDSSGVGGSAAVGAGAGGAIEAGGAGESVEGGADGAGGGASAREASTRETGSGGKLDPSEIAESIAAAWGIPQSRVRVELGK